MRKLLIAGGCVTAFLMLVFVGYPLLDAQYQRNMDPVRRDHAQHIADVIREYADQTGHLPFQEQAIDKPFMVFLGHSSEHEDHFANDRVLKRNATWANSKLLESELSEGLGRAVNLPRDPQTVATYAPNVYVYFVSGNQMSVVSHLCYPHKQAVKYEWNGNSFYSYTITYNFTPSR